MKKLLLVALCSLSTITFADQLHTYDQIKNAAASGKQVHFYIEYSKCAGPSKVTIPNYSAVYTPNEMLFNDDTNYMATSLNHFTLNDPQFPNKPVYEFTRYTLASDGTLTLSSQTLNAADYSALTNKFTFTCKLDENVKVFD